MMGGSKENPSISTSVLSLDANTLGSLSFLDTSFISSFGKEISVH